MYNVVEGRVRYRIAFGQNVELSKEISMLCIVRLKPTYLLRREIQPYSVIVSDSMSVRPTAPTPSLKVLAANQTGVYIDVAQTL